LTALAAVYRAQSSAMVFFSTPTLSTSTSTTSPGFIQTGGSRRAPTPPGVPLTITSPGAAGVLAAWTIRLLPVTRFCAE
jgi:hypothetical protein